MANQKQMIDALRAIVIPTLKDEGFSGSFPHFRRGTAEHFDLITFQFDRGGGGYIIEIARCLPGGIETPARGLIKAAKATVWDRHPNYRKRLQPRDGGGPDAWFRYESAEPVDVATATRRLLVDPSIWADVSALGSETPYR